MLRCYLLGEVLDILLLGTLLILTARGRVITHSRGRLSQCFLKTLALIWVTVFLFLAGVTPIAESFQLLMTLTLCVVRQVEVQACLAHSVSLSLLLR